MSKILDLTARVKAITEAHLAEKAVNVNLRADIARLEGVNMELTARVAVLVEQGIADDKQIAEMLAMIDGALDSGASMGGVL